MSDYKGFTKPDFFQVLLDALKYCYLNKIPITIHTEDYHNKNDRKFDKQQSGTVLGYGALRRNDGGIDSMRIRLSSGSIDTNVQSSNITYWEVGDVE